MASFAKIGLSNKVIEVHSVHNDVLKDAGGIEQNVNRWRKQINLEPQNI